MAVNVHAFLYTCALLMILIECNVHSMFQDLLEYLEWNDKDSCCSYPGMPQDNQLDTRSDPALCGHCVSKMTRNSIIWSQSVQTISTAGVLQKLSSSQHGAGNARGLQRISNRGDSEQRWITAVCLCLLFVVMAVVTSFMFYVLLPKLFTTIPVFGLSYKKSRPCRLSKFDSLEWIIAQQKQSGLFPEKYQRMRLGGHNKGFSKGKRNILPEDDYSAYISKNYRFHSSCIEPIQVYTLQLSATRVVSYRNFPLIPNLSSVSFTLLAEAGFKYNGTGTTVTCEGCFSSFDISDFANQNPSSSRFHSNDCQFVGLEAPFSDETSSELPNLWSQFDSKHEAIGEVHSGNTSSRTTYTAETVAPDTDSVPTAAYYEIDSAPTPGASSAGGVSISESDSSGASANSKQDSSGANNASQSSSATNANSSSNSYHASQSSLATTASSSSSSSTGSSYLFVDGSSFVLDAEMGKRCFHGSELRDNEFSPERDKPFREKEIKRNECEKNPGHYGYYTLDNPQLADLPEFVRCPEFQQFLSLLSDLTVRVVVGHTSSSRRKFHGAPIETQSKYRVGTGSAVLEPHFDSDAILHALGFFREKDTHPPDTMVAASTVDNKSDAPGLSKNARKKVKSALSSLRKRYKSLKKRSETMVFIETNRHIVFDDEEAQHTTVEFFFDKQSRQNVRQMKGSYILHNGSFEGAERSYIVCRTNDHAFVQTMREKRHRLGELVQEFPAHVREEIHKRVLLLHHPHGGEKVYSFGEFVVHRYILGYEEAAAATSSQSKLKKLKGYNQNPEDVVNMRKMMLYAADTCPGSSGAPIVRFKATGRDDRGGPTLSMELWMHAGQEIAGALNMSALEACTRDDITPPVRLYTPIPEPRAQFSGPIVRMGIPQYPVYTSLQKRLESFAHAEPGTFFHTAEELAQGGFYWAGYGDCVRCFYCGVGLRKWRSGDDLFLEHERVRPDCHFLILQLRVFGLRPKRAQRAAPPAVSAAVSAAVASYSGEAVASGVSNAAESIAGPVGTAVSCHGTPSGSRKDVNKPHKQDVTAKEREEARLMRLKLKLVQTENALLQRPLICKVCNVDHVRQLYLPCGHMDSCEACTPRLTNCVTCRTKILATVKVFFS